MWLWLSLSLAVAAEPLRLDPGPVDGLTMPGFVALTPSGCEDARVRWVTPGASGEAGVHPDPLAGDGVSGGVLQVDVPPGRWRVWAMFGELGLPASPFAARAYGLRAGRELVVEVQPPTELSAVLASPGYARVPRPVMRPGETIWDRQVQPATAWLVGDVMVVGAEGLELRPFGRALTGLVLAPEGQQEAEQVFLAGVEAARRDFFHRHHLAPVVTPEPPADDALVWGDWRSDPMSAAPVSRDRLPMVLARDERRGFLLWWRGSDEDVQVTVDAPAGLAVSLFEVPWLDLAGADPRVRGPSPSWLVPSQGDISGGQGLPPGMAVVLRPGAGVPAGRHTVSLGLTRGRDSRTVRVEIDVLDVDLSPSAVKVGAAWATSLLVSSLAGHDSPAQRDHIAQDLALQRELGFDLLVSAALLPRGPALREDPKEAVAQAAWVFDRWHALGGSVVGWAGFGGLVTQPVVRRGEGIDEADWPLLDAMLEVVAQAPLPVLVKLWDEEGGKSAAAVERARAVVPALRERAAPGTRLWAAFGLPQEVAVASMFDVVVVPPVPTIDLAKATAARDAGAIPWRGGGPYRRTSAWQAWATGMEAWGVWHWNVDVGDPYADVARHPAFNLSVLDPQGQVRHGLVAEQVADGVQDVRLFAALERAAEGARGREAQAARAILTAVREAADGSLASAWYGDDLMDPSSQQDVLQAVREALAALTR